MGAGMIFKILILAGMLVFLMATHGYAQSNCVVKWGWDHNPPIVVDGFRVYVGKSSDEAANPKTKSVELGKDVRQAECGAVGLKSGNWVTVRAFKGKKLGRSIKPVQYIDLPTVTEITIESVIKMKVQQK